MITYTKVDPMGDGTEIVTTLNIYPNKKGYVKIGQVALDLILREAGYSINPPPLPRSWIDKGYG